MPDVATDTSTTTSTTTDTATSASTAPAKPWFEGKAAPEDIGLWENRGLKKDDATDIAIKMTQSYRELHSKMGVPPERLLKLPERPDDTAGWAAVNARLGVPAKPEEYDFSGLKYADGNDVEQGFVDTLRASLHQAGVRKDAARAIAQDLVKFSDGAEAQAAAETGAQRATNLAELQKLWGGNAELNRLRAMEGARRLGLSKEATELMEGQIGYVNLMEAMRKIGVGTSEDTFVEAGQGGTPTTANGAKARLAELQADPEWSRKLIDPKSGAAEKREFQNLMQMIHGEAA